MINVKKNIIIVLFILFCLFLCFFFGYKSGEITGSTGMENRIDKAESLLNRSSERIRGITEELKEAEPQIKIIESGNRDIREKNIKINNSLGYIKGGISGDIKAVSEIIKGIEYYINETTETEKDNSNSFSN